MKRFASWMYGWACFLLFAGLASGAVREMVKLAGRH
jgi:hypothetical protein